MTVQFFHSWSPQADDTQERAPLLAPSWPVVLSLLTAFALACLTARDGLLDIYQRWAHEEEYGHGFLVVALVGLILWRRWPALRAASTGPKWPGLALVVVAQVCAVLGALAESYYVEQISFVLTVLGLMLVVCGTGAIWMLAPLAVLLLLTIPLPYTMQAMLTVRLQLVSTEIGVGAIRLLGIPVFVEGNIIDLGQYKLHVAEACSGLRYLLPLTCISFIFGFLYKAPYWKRAVVVASAAPITLLINGFRIAVVAVLVDNFGLQMADGFMHQLEGWVVFFLGGLLLGIEVLVLERFRLKDLQIGSILDSPADSPNATHASTQPLSLGASAASALVVCGVAVVVASSIAWAHESAPKPQRETFAGFPREIGAWMGQEEYLDAAALKIIKATDYFMGDYARSPASAKVGLFISYYDSLSKGGAIHSPRVCLPGSGWEFASLEQRDFNEVLPGTPGTFNRVVIQKGEHKILMYYWIQQRERRTASEFSAKYYLLVDGLTKARKDGALVRLHTPIVADGAREIAEAEERLVTFARAALPRTARHLP
jgi:exosortase D (VPLPA-CTERM-specific)